MLAPTIFLPANREVLKRGAAGAGKATLNFTIFATGLNQYGIELEDVQRGINAGWLAVRGKFRKPAP